MNSVSDRVINKREEKKCSDYQDCTYGKIKSHGLSKRRLKAWYEHSDEEKIPDERRDLGSKYI